MKMKKKPKTLCPYYVGIRLRDKLCGNAGYICDMCDGKGNIKGMSWEEIAKIRPHRGKPEGAN